MNTREALMWIRLRIKMGHMWDACRHEDYVAKGLPDVSFGARGVNGWIELKCLPAWPAKDDTIVKIPHYSQEQKNFLRSRGSKGGRCWLLLKVKEDWYLFNYENAMLVGSLPKTGLFLKASFISTTREFDPSKFLEIITSFH